QRHGFICIKVNHTFHLSSSLAVVQRLANQSHISQIAIMYSNEYGSINTEGLPLTGYQLYCYTQNTAVPQRVLPDKSL
mgnify:CR=1